MSEFRERIPDDDREVPHDTDELLDTTPPTIDPAESVEYLVDDLEVQERESAIEAGEIDPD